MTKRAHRTKESQRMNPDSQSNQSKSPTKPTTATSSGSTTTSATSSSNNSTNSSLTSKLKRLDTPQKLLLLAAALMAILLATLAIYQATKEAPSQPAIPSSIPQASVAITGSGFDPATITIKAGTQLTWTNTDSNPHQVAANPHPLHDSIEGFDSDTTLLTNDSTSYIFETPGSFSLHDHLNPLDAKYQLRVVVE